MPQVWRLHSAQNMRLGRLWTGGGVIEDEGRAELVDGIMVAFFFWLLVAVSLIVAVVRWRCP